MKYRHVDEDLRAIRALFRAGRIDADEAREMLDYVVSLGA